MKKQPIIAALPALVLALIAAMPVSAQKYNFDVENLGQSCNAAYKALGTANSALPDPFAMHSGTRITDKSEWACRRNEVKKDLEQYEIGPKPDPSTATVAATLSGSTLTVKVTTKDGTINLTSTVSGSGECVAIGMNGSAGNISGCKQIPFNHDQVVTYANGGGSHNLNDPFYTVYPDLKNKIGKYAAWSWGISRLIDGIVQVKTQLGVDVSKIGIQGCSYAGKMALFGGALDERVTLTVVQESGGGGINAWRTSKAFTARTGTNIEKIDNTNYSWFLSSMKNLNPDQLPHDHHQLIALIAPRPVIILGNPDMEWLGDESGYKSTIAARKVWQAFGVADYFGFDFAAGHNHCAASSSQATNVTAFVNRFLKGQSNVNTKIEANKPNKSNFNLDTTVSWTVPTLTGTYGGSAPTPSKFTLTTTVSPATDIPEGVGSVTFSPAKPSDGKYDSATVVKLTAVPANGYAFDSWSGDVTGTKDTVSVTMNAAKTVTATFKAKTGIRNAAYSAKRFSGLTATTSNSALNVTFNAKNSGATLLKLYSLKGDLISSASINTVAGNNYSHTFNAGRLSNGYYLVSLYNGGRIIEQARVVIPR
jgi:hypothetical protein